MFAKGANTALRVPTTMSAPPVCIIRHCSRRSVWLRAECCTATRSPKLAFRRRIIWGVRLISGTSTRAVRPSSRQRWMSFKNTSVLPLAVTPWSRAAAGFCWAIWAARPSNTRCWSSLRTTGSSERGMPA